jgi:hypothetical protein
VTAAGTGAEPREVTDEDGIAWTCIQAFAGLGNDAAKQDAARLPGSDRVAVVCTPSGGARSRRAALPTGWQTMNDGDLLAAIRRAPES